MDSNSLVTLLWSVLLALVIGGTVGYLVGSVFIDLFDALALALKQ